MSVLSTGDNIFSASFVMALYLLENSVIWILKFPSFLGNGIIFISIVSMLYYMFPAPFGMLLYSTCIPPSRFVYFPSFLGHGVGVHQRPFAGCHIFPVSFAVAPHSSSIVWWALNPPIALVMLVNFTSIHSARFRISPASFAVESYFSSLLSDGIMIRQRSIHRLSYIPSFLCNGVIFLKHSTDLVYISQASFDMPLYFTRCSFISPHPLLFHR